MLKGRHNIRKDRTEEEVSHTTSNLVLLETG
jgi:hypothetical protein